MSGARIMPNWLRKEKESNVCAYCGAEIPNDTERCPKCGLSNAIMRTTTCDFCSSEIPSNVKICPKCHKEQVKSIIVDMKSAGTYDVEERTASPKMSLGDTLKLHSKMLLIILVVALLIGFIGGGIALALIGIAIIFITAFIGGTYMPSWGFLPRRDTSESPPDPIWAIMGAVGLLFILLGAIFYKIL